MGVTLGEVRAADPENVCLTDDTRFSFSAQAFVRTFELLTSGVVLVLDIAVETYGSLRTQSLFLLTMYLRYMYINICPGSNNFRVICELTTFSCPFVYFC